MSILFTSKFLSIANGMTTGINGATERLEVIKFSCPQPTLSFNTLPSTPSLPMYELLGTYPNR